MHFTLSLQVAFDLNLSKISIGSSSDPNGIEGIYTDVKQIRREGKKQRIPFRHGSRATDRMLGIELLYASWARREDPQVLPLLIGEHATGNNLEAAARGEDDREARSHSLTQTISMLPSKLSALSTSFSRAA